MKIIKLLYAFYFCTIILGFNACDLTEDLDPDGTAVEEMAGDWFIKIYAGDVSNDNLLSPSYFRISTYNTSANLPTELWIDDHEAWPLKAIVPVNIQSLTFIQGDAGTNEYDDSVTATVQGGQIWDDAVVAASGTTTDSIQIRFSFSDFPDSEVIYAGYRRTGFPEDEH